MNKALRATHNLSTTVALRRKHWSGKSLGGIFLHKVVEKITLFGSFYYRHDILLDFANKGLSLVHRDIINQMFALLHRCPTVLDLLDVSVNLLHISK